MRQSKINHSILQKRYRDEQSPEVDDELLESKNESEHNIDGNHQMRKSFE
jgi:hypothetical protein